MQNINQFAMTTEQGVMDLRFNPAMIDCQVDAGQATPLTPGQPVTMVDSAGGIPKVIAAAADTADIFGFVAYSMKRTVYAAGEKLSIAAYAGNVMYMTASAAIARNAQVMVVIASKKVATAAGSGKRVIGRAFDKAAADGDLIRVWINLPGALVP